MADGKTIAGYQTPDNELVCPKTVKIVSNGNLVRDGEF